MLQSLLVEPGRIRVEEREVPHPGEGQVLISLDLVGICGSDVHLFRNGSRTGGPLTIGHEGIGRIEALGPGVPGNRLGGRVVIEPNIPCTACPECRKGRGNICRNKRIIGVTETGCFTEYICLPEGFAHPLPDSISDADAVTIEPAAVALAALRRSGARPGDTLAVIGLGSIGMLLAHLALSKGFRVLFTEPEDSKIEKARAMGAIHVPGGETREETKGLVGAAFREVEVTAVFECAGTADSVNLAIESAPRGSDVILLGLTEDMSTFSSYHLLRQGIRIIPSLIYDHPVDFRQCIRMVEEGLISPGMVVSKYYPLSGLQEALEEAARKTEGKIVIRIHGQ